MRETIVTDNEIINVTTTITRKQRIVSFGDIQTHVAYSRRLQI